MLNPSTVPASSADGFNKGQEIGLAAGVGIEEPGSPCPVSISV